MGNMRRLWSTQTMLESCSVRQVAFLSNHVVKHACKFLPVIGLSSAEKKYYVISMGACAVPGLQSLLRDLDVSTPLRIASDSAAARTFTSR